MLTGSTLSAFYWAHAIAPFQLRATSVLVAASQNLNSSTAYHALQLHRGNPVPGQVPLFSFFMPPSSTTVFDSTHLGGDGIASDDMWLAISTTVAFYTATTLPNGISQLMIR